MMDSSGDRGFQVRADRYEALIDWPRRLANEGAFFRRQFERAGVRRVLDAACGTGHHANMFHSWELEVEGADLSPEMIAHARAVFGESDALRWVVRSFAEPAATGPFDAVVCVGNSLALAGDRAVVSQAVRAMLAGLRSGGVLIVQVLNLWSLPEGPTKWQKCKRVAIDGGNHVLLKGVHRAGSQAFVDLVDLTLGGGDEVESRFDSAVFSGIEADDLVSMAAEGGAVEPQLFGSHQEAAYDRATSGDLILVCRKG